MTRLESIRCLGSDLNDLDRTVSDLEGAAQQQGAMEVVGRIRVLLSSPDAVLSAVLLDGADYLIDEPDGVLRRFRECPGENPNSRAPGPH